MTTRRATALFFSLLAAATLTPAGAQEPETCTVVRALENGSLQVLCGGEPFLAITPDMAREALKQKEDLEAAEAKLALREREIETYQREVAAFEETLARKNEQIALLEEVKEDYKDLAEGYKKLDRRGWLSFQGGVGVVDGDPAAIVGLGVSKFRIWGYAQENNSGVLVGLQYPIF